MKKLIFKIMLVALVVCMGNMNVHAQENDTWREVVKAMDDDSPRDVIAKANKVYKQAEKKGDFPVMASAWIAIVKSTCELDPDSFELAKFPELKPKTPGEKAVWNALQSSANFIMAGSHLFSRDADKRKERNDRAKELMLKAFDDMEALADEKAERFIPLVKIGEDSRLYNDDLLSVLLNFAKKSVGSWNFSRIYKDVIEKAVNLYDARGNKNAWALLKMELIDDNESPKLKIEELGQMLEQCRGLDAEPIVALQYYYTMVSAYSGDENWARPYEFLQQCVAKYKGSKVHGEFVNELNEMETKTCNIDFNDLLPDVPSDIKIEYMNASSFDLEVREYNGLNSDGSYNKSGRLVLTRHYDFPKDSTAGIARLRTYHDKLTLAPGRYLAYGTQIDGKKVELGSSQFNLTSLHLSLTTIGERKIITVMDRQTGRPVPNVQLCLIDDEDDEASVRVDEKGEYELTDSKYRYCYAKKNDKDYTERLYLSRIRQNPEKPVGEIQTTADRSIYRPGQTVHLAFLAFANEAEDRRVLADEDLKVTISDEHHKEMLAKTLRSNEWGSASLDFDIPRDDYTHYYDVIVTNAKCARNVLTLRVEEYKRPTFQVNTRIIDGQKELAFGDSVKVEVEAKTFSGVPVRGARVFYDVSVSTGSMRYLYYGRTTDLFDGELVTDDEGKAVISFATDTTNATDDEMLKHRYSILAEVTDMAGESHEARQSVAISKVGFNLRCYDEIFDRHKPSDICATALNANSEPVQASGSYVIKDRKGNKMYEGEFKSGQPIIVPSLPLASYEITYTAKDSRGHEVKNSRRLDVIDSEALIALGAKTKAEATDYEQQLIRVEDDTFSENHPARIIFSPIHDDVYLYYTLVADNGLVERKAVEVGRHLYEIKVPYMKQYGSAATLMLMYVRNGKIFNQQYTFAYKAPESQLNLKWSTFRDHLYPGQKEEWVLNVTDQKGRRVDAAEMMMTMFDASLLKLQDYFYMDKNLFRLRPHTKVQSNISILKNYISGLYTSWRKPWVDSDELEFSMLYSFPIIHKLSTMRLRGAAPVMMKNVAATGSGEEREFAGLSMISVDDALQGRIAGLDVVAVGDQPAQSAITLQENVIVISPEDEKLLDNVQMRSNFAETAFFYPHLTTDSQGDIHIAFTLPESLTEWAVRGFAHTKDLKSGVIDTTVVACKDFMIQPNMPRFVRGGDHVSIVSRVINQTSEAMNVKVRFRLVDPETDEVVMTQEKAVDVEGMNTGSVEFEFDAKEDYPMLVCEVVGVGENGSDGERNYLPVLPAKKYITETIPYYIYDGEEKTIELDGLFNEGSKSASQKRMVVEHTTNPSWTVIEALEGMIVVEDASATNYAASLYANTWASRLAQSVPGLKEAIAEAMRNGGEDAMDSELENNDELKDIALRESPWLREALKEKNQRKALIDLFDSVKISSRLTAAMGNLKKQQHKDGSWSWFDGMDGNYNVTLSVCEMLAMLDSDDEAVVGMLTKGMEYLDKVQLERYRLMNMLKVVEYVGDDALHYMYVWSMMPDREVGKDVLRMRDDYLKIQSKHLKHCTIYGKANLARIYKAFGFEKEAVRFLKSAVDYSIVKPGMGRYYATDKALYSWRDYRVPTQIAVMEALKVSDREDKADLLNDMQLWLLRQKQTQMWDTPMSTIAAVRFMLDGKEGMKVKPVPRFYIDGQDIKAEADNNRLLAKQLGYVKTEVDKAVVAGTPKQMTVKSAATVEAAPADKSQHISWGAVYAQYLEDMDALSDQTSGELKITRRLMVDGKDVTGPLKVGDKVVMRLSVTADRDMDFIQVRSQHPACFEPVKQLSGYRYQGGYGSYVSMHDASIDIFFDKFAKGTMTYDIEFFVTRTGEYHSGVATVQCAYSPEFVGHTKGTRVDVKP